MSEIIDLKDVMERVQDDKELLLELLEIYQEDFVGKRKALGEAIKNNEFQKVKELAHSLKGSSGNISAKPLHANFLKIEYMLQNKDLSMAGAVLAEIDQQFAQLKLFVIELNKKFSA